MYLKTANNEISRENPSKQFRKFSTSYWVFFFSPAPNIFQHLLQGNHSVNSIKKNKGKKLGV